MGFYWHLEINNAKSHLISNGLNEVRYIKIVKNSHFNFKLWEH